MQYASISDEEFSQYQRLLHKIAGIHLSPAKKPLLVGRLGKRVQQGSYKSFGEYFQYLTSESGRDELRIALDLLTTNETYFFREQKHFDFLADKVIPSRKAGATFRVWSAACSSGEEPYSIAMVLADKIGDSPWEIVASDLSTRVLEKARSGHYALDRAEKIPPAYRTAYCLKGVGSQEGTFLVQRMLRDRIRFLQINLNESLPKLAELDVIFLRNVMIYFDMDTKRQVLERVYPLLRKGGYFLISHSESLNGVTEKLKVISPSIYQKT
jgi:chemotaxis protein methyltransferase CheR